MPKRTDLHKILVLGSGGITIGQACEFDYSGTQAIKALRAEGYEVILVNSNPATIMTDPELSDQTYIEPLTVPAMRAILEKERPDALLPTVGGQTALNLTLQMAEAGLLREFSVEVLGAGLEAIELAEDRQAFRQAMLEIGVDVPASVTVRTVEEALAFAKEVGYPVIVRPSFTLGGSGGGMAADATELANICRGGLRESPVGQVLVEQSVAGWKEFELEVIRDRANNFIVVCSIENMDPMGVHTGDSVTVAPAQTLTDREYQKLRDWSRRIMERIGVETGGSNVQFGVDPVSGRIVVIEMNPRVSRSSALASKATGFPIAKVAAKLAVGYTLDQIPNDITGTTPCSFEPALDYVVVKIPRWDFAKFPGADARLGPQMKSVGEVMAIGRNFCEAFQKGLRSLEIGLDGIARPTEEVGLQPNPLRMLAVIDALRQGQSVEQLVEATRIDPWFLDQFLQMLEVEKAAASDLRKAKQLGFSDSAIARLTGETAAQVRARRIESGIVPCFQCVDTCAAEFPAVTPYLYSSYQATVDEAEPGDREKVIILGSGPNRIGQGIEFDYCCVHASWALRELGIESVMINCNPETVSTDYDTSDRLYFEPLNFEDVLNVVEHESRRGKLLGVIVQLGGQTPLRLVDALSAAGVPLLGTSAESIHQAEDREQFRRLMDRLDLQQPRSATAANLEEVRRVADLLGYPLLLRPSYVLGGRAMAIVGEPGQLDSFAEAAIEVSAGHPVLIDQFLEDAVEVDVDCLGDGSRVVIAGVLQHIEEAGVHSGDSACVIPPYKVSLYHLNLIREAAHQLGKALKVRGLMNLQLAIKEDVVYVLEVNPRASRTVPFLAKATRLPLARLAVRLMLGQSLEDIGMLREPEVDGFFVKEALLPFRKFPGSDPRLGPEMRSTGEVMGQDAQFGWAFAKAQAAAGCPLPVDGAVLITVNDYDKAAVLKIGRDLHRLGFKLLATRGTAEALRRVQLPVQQVAKLSQGEPNLLTEIVAERVQLVINTPLHGGSFGDGARIRRAAIEHGIPLITTLSAAHAALAGIRALQGGKWAVRSLQELGVSERASV
jgi:carbamoyl-phosphate synthase large subunit